MSSNSSEPLEPKTEAAISNLFTNILKK